MPNEEPNHRLLAIVIVFQSHDTGYDLRLTGNAESSEEKGCNPEGGSKHEAAREDIDHGWVNGIQFTVQSRKAARALESDDAQDGRTDDHHT